MTISKPMSLVAALALTACASSSAPDPAPTTPMAAPTREAEPARRPAAATPAMAQPAAADATAMTFSKEQADNGRSTFRASCTECHNSSEFSDRQFKFKWRRRTAGDLFELVSTSMPEDSPGSLEGRQYASIIAYILRLNGFEEGTGELPADADALEAISLAPFGN